MVSMDNVVWILTTYIDCETININTSRSKACYGSWHSIFILIKGSDQIGNSVKIDFKSNHKPMKNIWYCWILYEEDRNIFLIPNPACLKIYSMKRRLDCFGIAFQEKKPFQLYYCKKNVHFEFLTLDHFIFKDPLNFKKLKALNSK